MADGTRPQGFTGFPPELFTFLGGLEANNSKAYWQANRHIWTKVIQPTVEHLMADLEPEFGALRTFRPNRDVRFSKDKSPYKTWLGITTSDRAVGGIGSFLRVEASGMRLAAGAMVFASDQIQQFRAAIDNAASAKEFESICATLEGKKLPVGPGTEAQVLRRPPPGYKADHPRLELLKWKGAVVVKAYDRAAWMSKPEALERIRDVWATAEPLVDWINDHIGASSTPSRRPR